MAHVPTNFRTPSLTNTVECDFPPITGSFSAVQVCVSEGLASAANDTSGISLALCEEEKPKTAESIADQRCGSMDRSWAKERRVVLEESCFLPF